MSINTFQCNIFGLSLFQKAFQTHCISVLLKLKAVEFLTSSSTLEK